MTTKDNSLAGARVLVPRDGTIGDHLSDAVSRRGGQATIAPVIEFRDPVDPDAFAGARDRLSSGGYDWVAVTSATTVEALVKHAVTIPEGTSVAVVGPATRDAMITAGFRVDFMPAATFSAAAMVAEWPGWGGSVLIPQSALAEPTLADGLARRGLAVTAVAAYDTVALDWTDDIRHRLGRGEFGAVLLTSASVARAVAGQGVPFPGGTIVACIGESTATGARTAGLPVHVVAETSTAEGLVSALGNHLLSTPTTRTEATP
jgi:uroporphyrinogen-III synthase